MSKILSYIFPQKYNWVEIVLNDTHTHSKIVKIPKDLRYRYNGFKYNMYQSRIPRPDGKSIFKQGQSVYRRGRLNKYYFREGNENPIDMFEVKPSGNIDITEHLSKRDIDQLWKEPMNTFDELISRYLPIIIVIGIAIIIFILTNQQAPTPEVVIQ